MAQLKGNSLKHTCIYFHLTSLWQRKHTFIHYVPMVFFIQVWKTNRQNHSPSLTPHCPPLSNFFSLSLSCLPILSHNPSPISHLSMSNSCLHTCLFYFLFLSPLHYFYFSTVSLQSATSSVDCHHPNNHSSTPNHLLNRSSLVLDVVHFYFFSIHLDMQF